jgi:hypothetical protein
MTLPTENVGSSLASSQTAGRHSGLRRPPRRRKARLQERSAESLDRSWPARAIHRAQQSRHRSFLADRTRKHRHPHLPGIDPINPRVETPEGVSADLVLASKHIPLERLRSTDDCGCSSFSGDAKPRRGFSDAARDIAFPEDHRTGDRNQDGFCEVGTLMAQIENRRAILAVGILSALGVGDHCGFGAGIELGTTQRAHCQSQVK